MKPIYTVTYCTQDQDVGANPLWHTCFFLSRYDEQTKKMEVVEAWGFYGLPTTQGQSWGRWLKMKLALDVDLWGNHGMLRPEDTRFMDTGSGLHGVTFEITEAKFIALQAKCKRTVEKQETAINNAVEKFGLKGDPKPRIYKYEKLGPHIFELEKAAAAEQGRSPGLREFSFAFSDPHTCKMETIRMNEETLTPEQIERVTGLHQAVSRFSGKMEAISLHSSGPMRKHTKASGDVVWYRDAGKDKEVKLYWTVPPQEIETLSDETRQLFEVHADYVDDVKSFAKQLQKLEALFRNARLDQKYEACRQKLLTFIIKNYEVYSIIEPKPACETDNSWSASFMYMWSKQPRDANEKNLQSKLKCSEGIFRSLHDAIGDTKSAEQLSEQSQGEDLLALAAVLSPKDQTQLEEIINTCVIIEDDSPEELLRAIC